MIIHQPEVTHAGGKVIVSARLEYDTEHQALSDSLWFAVPSAHAHLVCDRIDPFAYTLLNLAMLLNEPLDVRGALSPTLLYGMQKLMGAYRYWLPNTLHQIEVIYDGIAPMRPDDIVEQSNAVTFSGGLDSFYTFWAHQPEQQPLAPFHLDYAIYLHGFNFRLAQQDFFDHQLALYQTLFTDLGVTVIPIETNIRSVTIIHWFMHKHEMLQFGAALGALGTLLGRGITKLILPNNMHIDLAGANSYHPLLASYASTETLTVYDHGADTRRYQKLESVAAWRPVQRSLQVCNETADVSPDLPNCCRCMKCVVIMVGLEQRGLLDQFDTFPRPLTGGAIRSLWRSRFNESSREIFDDALRHFAKNRRFGLAFSIVYLLVMRAFYETARWFYRRGRHLLQHEKADLPV